MFGKGVYFADVWRKSLGYTHYNGADTIKAGSKKVDDLACLFLCDVCVYVLLCLCT